MIKLWEGRELFKRNKGSALLFVIKKGERNQTFDQAAFVNNHSNGATRFRRIEATKNGSKSISDSLSKTCFAPCMVQKFIQGYRGEKMANPQKAEVKTHAVDGLGAEKQMIKVWEGRELFKRNKGSALLFAIEKGGRNQTFDQAAFL